MANKFNPNGRILWEGLSPIDQKPIVCIVTGLGKGKSQNPKTGHMGQTWIIRQDIPPHEGHKNGENRSVCGSCPHAGYNNGSCYVRWFQAPLSVYKCYKRGGYKHFEDKDLDWPRLSRRTQCAEYVQDGKRSMPRDPEPVSYTHLTLPKIYSV